MGATRFSGIALVLLMLNGACRRTPGTGDSIAGIPETQQRNVSRHEFAFRWPFVAGTGTLGCMSGAVVFRANGVTYALNDAAEAQGFAPLTLARVTVDPGPRHPLARLKQDERTQIFSALEACGEHASACRQRLRNRYQLSSEELAQIEAEGVERHWPPLPPEYRSVAPLVQAGLQLCSASAGVMD